MTLRRLVLAAAVWALAAWPVWGAGEAETEGPESQPVTVASEIPMRPELEAFEGVRGWLVNGKEIKLDDVRGKAALFHGPFVLQDMVCELLLREEAGRRGITVSEQEVEAQIKAFREELGLRTEAALEYYLRRSRLTLAGLREKAAAYALMEKVLGDKVYVSDKQVERFYQTFRAQYRRPEAVEFRAIAVPTENDAEGVLVALRSGRSFEEVAREAASPESRARAGELHVYERGQLPGLPAELEAAVFAAPLNQVAGPIKVGTLYYLVRVEKKRDAYQFSLEEVRDVIRTQLRKQKLEQEVWPNWIRAQLAGAEIEMLRTE